MQSTAHQTQGNDRANGSVMYMAFDLGKARWHIATGDGQHHRIVSIAAGDAISLFDAMRKAKQKFKLPGSASIRSCYEAGRDGFWLHRFLEEQGIRNTVVDPGSIECNRRGRRAKTDKIDAKKLLRKLIQYDGGDRDVWSALHVPTREQEQERRLMRHRKELQKEINAHSARIRSLVVLHGINLERLTDAAIADAIRTLGPIEQQEIVFAQQRMQLAREQLSTLEAEQKHRLEESSDAPQASRYAREVERKIMYLCGLKGIGRTSAWRLTTEFFWRDFQNRREVGGAAGLTPTPHNSGNGEREQGISKTGNSAIRDMMVELAWLWLRWQPDSQLSLWFESRWAIGKRRRKVGIVAVARKLLIALWRYLEFGVVPEGAILKTKAEAA